MPRVDEARKGCQKKDYNKVAKAHEKKSIEEEPCHDVARGRYIRDIIYGASDGIITTFAVVAGAAGASLSSAIILILGFANLLADGFSMAVAYIAGFCSEPESATLSLTNYSMLMTSTGHESLALSTHEANSSSISPLSGPSF